jgi:hypothetical protein
MASAVYLLGSFVTMLCAWLLLRAYTKTRTKLLLWSGLCFVGLSISNALLWTDLVMLPHADLFVLRLATAAASMLLLLYGLIFESE